MSSLMEPQRLLIFFFLCLVRPMAVFSIMPTFSKQLIPGLCRNTIVIAVSLLVAPIIWDQLSTNQYDITQCVAIAFKEVLIGIILGYLGSFYFWVAECIGFFIDTQRGASMANLIDPILGHQTAPLGSFLFQLVAVFFIISGAFTVFLSILYESYVIWPVFSFFPDFNQLFPMFFIETLDELMKLVVLLGGPIIIVLFLSEFGLGMICRFAPQLNVFFLAMPIKSALSIFLFILYLPILLDFFQRGMLLENKMLFFLKRFFPPNP